MILQLVYAVAAIAGLVAIQVAALYAIWWLVLLVFRFIPIVGKKHRHENWQRLNRP
jgi:F0F1-type ATP synthase assembly protein I